MRLKVALGSVAGVLLAAGLWKGYKAVGSDNGGSMPLDTLRPVVSSMLRQPPAVLTFHRRQQSQHQIAGGASRLDPSEPASHTAQGLVKQHLPTGRVYAVACGHRQI